MGGTKQLRLTTDGLRGDDEDKKEAYISQQQGYRSRYCVKE